MSTNVADLILVARQDQADIAGRYFVMQCGCVDAG